MEQNKKIVIKGDGTPEYGKRIINYLKALGGINTLNVVGYTHGFIGYYYFIDNDNTINCKRSLPIDYTLIDLHDKETITVNKYTVIHTPNRSITKEESNLIKTILESIGNNERNFMYDGIDVYYYINNDNLVDVDYNYSNIINNSNYHIIELDDLKDKNINYDLELPSETIDSSKVTEDVKRNTTFTVDNNSDFNTNYSENFNSKSTFKPDWYMVSVDNLNWFKRFVLGLYPYFNVPIVISGIEDKNNELYQQFINKTLVINNCNYHFKYYKSIPEYEEYLKSKRT